MPNWCNNYVEFQGKEADLNNMIAEFKAMKEQESKTGEGQKPPYAQHIDESYIFDIIDPEIDGFIHFSTKWSSIYETVVAIAKKHNLTFDYEYSESGCVYHGKFVYDGETLKNYDVSEDVDELVYYNDETELYEFEGEEYECEDEVIEILIEREVKKNNPHIIDLCSTK